MSDNEKLALVFVAFCMVGMVMFWRADVEAYKEEVAKVKHERMQKIECIRSGNCTQGE